MGIRITTNHVRRDILDAWQIPPDVRAEFDYVDWNACDDGRDSVSFVRAYGQYWDLNDTEPGPGSNGGPLDELGWPSYVSQTYFSGVCFRWVQDDRLDTHGDWYVIVGRYYTFDEYGPDENGMLRSDEFCDKFPGVVAYSTTADNRISTALTRTQYIHHDRAARAYVVEPRNGR